MLSAFPISNGMNKLKLIASSAYAAIIAVIFVVVITVWAEMFTPLKDWLKIFSGHHWVSKSILSLLIYAAAAIALYFGFSQPQGGSLRRALIFLLISVALGIIVIALFYTGHHFGFF